MKFILQIVLVILVIIGLFFLLGYIVTEQRNISEVEVKAPRDLCWDIFQNENMMSEWMEGVERISMIEGTKGSVGSKQKITMKSTSGSDKLSEVSQLVRTITKNSPPSGYSYDYTNAILDGSTAVSFSISDSITIIRSEDVFSAKELWMRSTLFLMQGSIEKRTQNQFNKLKTIIENKYQTILSNDTLSISEIIKIEN